MEILIDKQTYNLIFKIIFSLSAGLIIGLEREHRTKEETFAGIRTFPLISIMGTLSAYINDVYWSGILYIVFGGLVLLTVLNFYLEYHKDIGATTEIATIITFMIGVIIYYEHYYIAAFTAVVTTILLALKKTLEDFAKKLSQEDIRAILKFALVTIIIYPLLPDSYMGPMNAFNPKEIWKMVVIVSSLDFISYVILRWKGTKQLWLTGVIGGLISSTAVSFELSKLSRKYPAVLYSALFGIILAWLIMNFRVLMLSGIINLDLVVHLIIPMTAVSSVYVVIIAYVFMKNREKIIEASNKDISFSNPFEITSALQFGLIYGLIMFITKLLKHSYGEKGIYLASFISGVIDVDAITLSLSVMAKESLDLSIAIKGILIAVLSNSFFKFIYIYLFGDRYITKVMFYLLVSTAVITSLFIFIY
ncbi:MgtC/SapB family protein [Persephonella sp.]